MICVRCLSDTARKVAAAPDRSGAWEVFYCERCNYSWRSTEGEQITVIEKRDPEFQLDQVDLNALSSPNPIPPLKRS
jgi:hypothetical protein